MSTFASRERSRYHTTTWHKYGSLRVGSRGTRAFRSCYFQKLALVDFVVWILPTLTPFRVLFALYGSPEGYSRVLVHVHRFLFWNHDLMLWWLTVQEIRIRSTSETRRKYRTQRKVRSCSSQYSPEKWISVLTCCRVSHPLQKQEFGLKSRSANSTVPILVRNRALKTLSYKGITLALHLHSLYHCRDRFCRGSSFSDTPAPSLFEIQATSTLKIFHVFILF